MSNLVSVYFCPILFMVSISFFSSCTTMNNLDIQGHRGYRGQMPENTVEGFLYALDKGVTTLEMDVVISGDKQVVVSHEPWMSPDICVLSDTIPDHRIPYVYNMYRMSYDEIKSFDCGSKPNPGFPDQQNISTYKPLLTEVIQTTRHYAKEIGHKQIRYNIEMKFREEGIGVFHPPADEFARILLNTLMAQEIEKQIIVQSFNIDCLQEVRKQAEDIQLALLVSLSENYREKLYELGFIPEILSPDHRLVDEDMINFAHDKGMKVIPWTVNDPDDIDRLIVLGVDGIISDYPDRIKGKNKSN